MMVYLFKRLIKCPGCAHWFWLNVSPWIRLAIWINIGKKQTIPADFHNGAALGIFLFDNIILLTSEEKRVEKTKKNQVGPNFFFNLMRYDRFSAFFSFCTCRGWWSFNRLISLYILYQSLLPTVKTLFCNLMTRQVECKSFMLTWQVQTCNLGDPRPANTKRSS